MRSMSDIRMTAWQSPQGKHPSFAEGGLSGKAAGPAEPERNPRAPLSGHCPYPGARGAALARPALPRADAFPRKPEKDVKRQGAAPCRRAREAEGPPAKADSSRPTASNCQPTGAGTATPADRPGPNSLRQNAGARPNPPGGEEEPPILRRPKTGSGRRFFGSERGNARPAAAGCLDSETCYKQPVRSICSHRIEVPKIGRSRRSQRQGRCRIMDVYCRGVPGCPTQGKPICRNPGDCGDCVAKSRV